MQKVLTDLPEVLLFEPKLFGDPRGYFYESFNARLFHELSGVNASFVQDNQSRSARGVLRGLHYQLEQAQGKLIRVVEGAIYDVAVDVRRDSPRFGQWTGFELSAQNRRLAWIPAGFAHGFLALEEGSTVLYKATHFYSPAHERSILWNDPAIGIQWPFARVGGGGAVQVSDKDRAGRLLAEAEVYASGPPAGVPGPVLGVAGQ